MATPNDDARNGTHFAWVIIPVIVAVGALLLLMYLRHRRMRQMRAQLLSTFNEIEASGPYYAHHHPMGGLAMSPPPRGRRPRPAAPRDLGRVEGLNEFGEAPPAYAPPRKPASDQPPVLDAPPPAAVAARDSQQHLPGARSSPPAYQEAQQQSGQPNTPGSPAMPTPPQPVVVNPH